MSNEKRAQWADGLDVPLMSENPGADVLYVLTVLNSNGVTEMHRQRALTIHEHVLAP